jgi:hypothetical protein
MLFAMRHEQFAMRHETPPILVLRDAKRRRALAVDVNVDSEPGTPTSVRGEGLLTPKVSAVERLSLWSF